MAVVKAIILTVFYYGFTICLAADSSIEYIGERINALEKQGTEQAELLQRQGSELVYLRSVIGDYKSRLQRQEQITEEYMKRVNELERGASNKQFGPNVQDTGGNEKDVSSALGEEAVSGQRPVSTKGSRIGIERIRKDQSPDGVVAFQAVFKGPGTSRLGAGNTIVYPDVVTNIGDGYNNHGTFVAPRAGIYIFSVSIASQHDTGANVGIMKNGQMIAGAFGDTGGNYEQGSVTIVTSLAVNDQVWIKLTSSSISSLFGYSFTSFMGCLIFPF